MGTAPDTLPGYEKPPDRIELTAAPEGRSPAEQTEFFTDSLDFY
jgi:hypothetical protein